MGQPKKGKFPGCTFDIFYDYISPLLWEHNKHDIKSKYPIPKLIIAKYPYDKCRQCDNTTDYLYCSGLCWYNASIKFAEINMQNSIKRKDYKSYMRLARFKDNLIKIFGQAAIEDEHDLNNSQSVDNTNRNDTLYNDANLSNENKIYSDNPEDWLKVDDNNNQTKDEPNDPFAKYREQWTNE
ncbi:MAG: hypothetical protein QXP41_00320 [Candidatus Nitrosocaldus sp.]